MAVDYSSRDFHQSLAAIDAASRERDGVRVTHQVRLVTVYII